MSEHELEVRFSPVRHPQSIPSERVVKELSKFCRNYCHKNHKRWADLLAQIEQWLNKTLASPSGINFQCTETRLLRKVLSELGDSPGKEDLAAKGLKAYTRMKEKASKRDSRRKLGNSKSAPRINDKVLVKTQPVSDAIKGETSKFMLLYEGPFLISKIYPLSAYELKDENGSARGKFSKKALKPYREETQQN